MYPAPFRLERFFARYEFSARHLLSASDCEGPTLAELLALAGDDLHARWERLTLGYTESQGLPELREAIAGGYHETGANQVLVTAPEELIFLAMHALLSPGDHVVCTFPGYQSLYELARSIGCEVDLWQPDEPNEAAAGRGWHFDPTRLQALLRPRTKLVVWNFPHNPTGALPSIPEFMHMVDAVARVGAWLFSDEMYRLLEPAAALRLPSAVGLYERAVSLAGMSKVFGLAGLRIGWVVIRDSELLDRMKILKDYTTICSSAPSEVLALIALRSADTILSANVARVERNVRLARGFFEQHPDVFAWTPPRAGTVCFPRLLSAAAMVDAEAFCGEVLEKTGVLLLPSTVYDYGNSRFRLGLGREDFDTGLDVLDGFLRERRGEG